MWGRTQPGSGWNSNTTVPGGQGQQLPGINTATNWSLDPNHYTQIPHNQVDWASLAQQWIQMKGTNVQAHDGQSQEVAAAHVHHQLPPPSIQSFNQQQQQHHQDVIGEAPMDLDDSVSTPLYTRSSAPAAGPIVGTTPNAPPHFPQHHQHQTWSQPAFHMNQMDEHLRRNSAAAAPDGNNFQNTPWTQNHSSVDFSSYNDRRYSANYADRRQSYQEEETYEEDFAEAARRRALPSWIREGLEKVEREKRKAEEKERLAAQREEERRLQRKQDQEQTEISQWSDDRPLLRPEEPPPDEPAVIFGSDGDQEGFSIKLKGSFRQSQPRQLSLEEILASLTKDDQMEQVMLSVRRQLTKILLQVTNDEMRAVAAESIEKAKAKQKVTSSRGQSLVALTSLTGGPLGLGDYGSDSDSDSSNSDDVGPLDNEVDSEDELIAEIERKKRNFELNLLADEEDDKEESNKPYGKSTTSSRSRSKSGDRSVPGTNGKIVHSQPVSLKPVVSQSENQRGEERKVDEKKAERKRGSRSRSREKNRHDSSASRRYSSSSHKSEKTKRSRSRDRKRRSPSPSRERRHSHRSRSNSSSHRDKGRRKSRSSSKSRKDRRSRSLSKSNRSVRRRSRSTSKTKSKNKQKSRSPSLSKSKNRQRSRTRSSSKSKSKSKRKSRSSSRSRKNRRRSRSSSKSKHERRKSRSLSKSRKEKKRRRQSRSTSGERTKDKERKSDTSKRRRRSASTSSTRSSRSNSPRPTRKVRH